MIDVLNGDVSLFAIDGEDSPTNYVKEALQLNLLFSSDFSSILFEQMERESTAILASLEVNEIVFEAQAVQTKKGIFQRIVSFIKQLFTMFTDKTKAMVMKNNAWLANEGTRLDKLNYEGLQIEMVPFWTMTIEKIQSDCNKLGNTVLDALKNSSRHKHLKDMDAVKKQLFPQYLDAEGDIAGGFKNYLRTGNAKIASKPVVLRDKALKDMVIKEFRPYCTNYEKTVLPFVKKATDDAQRQLTMIENTLVAKKVAAESFCFIEDMPYNKTELIYCENFIVLEAEQPPQNNNDQQQNKPDNKQANTTQNDQPKPSATKVNVTDHGNNANAKMQDDLNTMSVDQLTIIRNIAQIDQIIISSIMTVMEERYTAYMNAMRQIYSARVQGLNDQEKATKDAKAKAAKQENLKNKKQR